MDWPIGYDDLAPYYDRVEWELGVCGADAPRPYDGARRRGYPMPPFAPNAARARARARRRGARAGHRPGAAAHQLGALRRAPGVHPLRHLRGLRLPRRRQERQPQHDDRARGRHRPLRPPHGHRRHAAHHAGRPRRRSGARAGRPAARGPRAATSWSPRARSRPRGCCWPARSGPRTTRSAATSRVTSTRAPSASSTSRCRTASGPGPSISTTDYRHHNDGILGGGILANEFVPIPIEAYLKLSGAGVVPAWGQAGADAMRETYTRAQFVVGPIQEVPAADLARHARARASPTATACPPCACCPLPASANDVAQRRVPGRARGGVAASQRRPDDHGAVLGAAHAVRARASTRPAAAAWAPTRARP